MIKVLFSFGTRPETIKLAPLVFELKKRKEFSVEVCITAQHREMLDQMLNLFEIHPELDLDLMTRNQSLGSLTARIIESFTPVLERSVPDILIVQGDTTTTFATSLCAFYQRIPVGHVEAGLRSFNKYAPYPEEINRRLTSCLADFHFAPTERAKGNLLKEGCPPERVYVTGNTVVDAQLFIRERLESLHYFPQGLFREIRLDPQDASNIILITGHRRENFGEGIKNICLAIFDLSEMFPGYHFLYPVHLNPNIHAPVKEILSARNNVHLVKPLDYLDLQWILMRCRLIITDSGGLQEEGATFGKPILVMREVTERPEAVEAGNALLVGSDRRKIVDAAKDILSNEERLRSMSRKTNCFGDGKASGRIADILQKELKGG